MQTIGWVKISSRRYGGVIYEEKAMEVLKGSFDVEYLKVNSNLFKRGYLRAPELIFNLLKLGGKKDLWVRDSNTVITAPFDRTRGKKVAIVHHIDFSATRPLFKLIDFVIEKLMYHGLKKMDAVITVSQHWKEHFLKRGFRNVFVVYNSFNLNEFNVSDKDAEKFREENGLTGKPVIYIGNCQRAKGTVEAYEALKDLNVHLVTSGVPFVKIPARNFELSYPDYLKLLKSSSICVTMTKFKEGWCRTAHEAMLLKTPVIGSGLGGMGELLKGGGQVICSGFPDLRSRVESLLQNPQLKKEMGEKGYEYAKGFSEERFKEEWIKVINNII
ncbi:MAG: glycosyltransferase family 4 protein [Candidatus Nealsonbacteria bacterium]|nr:glycosyltransferase family 4 protein [Candidatus Nealsonbacteria bacterium]